MMLHELKPAEGASKAAKRKGRGAGSGNGKTAGYGHKGQKARSGAKKAGFEGGQMPLQRRLPKRGFNNIFATEYATIKVSDLEKFEAGSTVDANALIEKGIIKKTLDGVKVLGNGTLTKALNVKLTAYSASAKGFGGDVSVTITVEDGKITDAVVTGDNETPSSGGQAVDTLGGAIVEAQSAEFDSVSGATVTSSAVRA